MSGNLLTLLGQAAIGLILQIGLIVLLAWLVIRAISALARRIDNRLQRREAELGRRARLQTLLKTGSTTSQTIIVLLAALTALYALGINITPLLTGVGVAGLAVSLGAQALIRDFIGGFLILAEDQFHVGDIIQIGTTTGTVEEIHMRTTRLRDDEGKLWIVPNGDVRTVSNFTRDWARAVVDLNLPAAADTGRAVAALEEAMQRVAADASVANALLAAPEVRNWNSLTDTTVQVRLLAKTAPGKQWDVARVMRQYAMAALRDVNANGARAELAANDTPQPAPHE